MRKLLADLVCCPECRQFPLDLRVIEEGARADLPGTRRCERYCAGAGRPPDREGPPCSACLSETVETGYFLCPSCERFYFIIDGIPRLLGEDYAALIDWSLADREGHAFEAHGDALQRFRERVSRDSDGSATAAWNLDDVDFWQGEVYADNEETRAAFERISRARADAGNRTYPREKTIFRHMRPTLNGGVLIDLGCGLSQTVRTLCPPDEVGYVYVGVELSIAALRTNRQTLAGDFVQCSADQLPFRDSSADAVLALGTLHHLADPPGTVRLVMSCLRPRGFLGANEVIYRPHVASRRGLGSQPESAHNEAIDLEEVRAAVEAFGAVRELRFRTSPVRGLLARRLDEPMRDRPWLTRVVLGVDDLCLGTLGRLSRYFGPREALLLAQKNASGAPAS